MFVHTCIFSFIFSGKGTRALSAENKTKSTGHTPRIRPPQGGVRIRGVFLQKQEPNSAVVDLHCLMIGEVTMIFFPKKNPPFIFRAGIVFACFLCFTYRRGSVWAKRRRERIREDRRIRAQEEARPVERPLQDPEISSPLDNAILRGASLSAGDLIRVRAVRPAATQEETIWLEDQNPSGAAAAAAAAEDDAATDEWASNNPFRESRPSKGLRKRRGKSLPARNTPSLSDTPVNPQRARSHQQPLASGYSREEWRHRFNATIRPRNFDVQNRPEQIDESRENEENELNDSWVQWGVSTFRSLNPFSRGVSTPPPSSSSHSTTTV